MLNYILKCYLSKKSFLNKIEAVQRLAPILNISATCSILIGQMPSWSEIRLTLVLESIDQSESVLSQGPRF